MRGLLTALVIALAACGRVGFQSTAGDAPIRVADAPSSPDAPISVVLASDDYARTVASGWGNADVGGTWEVYNPDNSTVDVGSGHGNVAMTSTTGYVDAHVMSGSAVDAETRVIVSFDQVPTTASYIAAVSVRFVAVGTDYRLQLDVFAGGSAEVHLERGSAGTYTALDNPTSSPTVTPNAGVALSVRATASSPTTLCGKAWLATTAEPSACTVTVTDSTSELQTSGTSYLITYDNGDAPPTVSFSTFRYLQVGPM